MKTKGKITGLMLLFTLLSVGATNAVSAAETPKKPERPKLYDTNADANKQIAEALGKAKTERKRLILKFGANW